MSSVPLPPSVGDITASGFIMSPHDPSLASLLGSMLEPNFLILVLYLTINLALAFKVVRVATMRYRQLQLEPRDSGELKIVGHSIDDNDDDEDDTEPVNLHQRSCRDSSDRSTPRRSNGIGKSDTPVADALIRVATWAFRNKAANAKRIVALLAMISLASTWYYMIAFLRQSYLEYLERCRLTSYPLPPAPPPLSFSRLDALVPALHLRVLRMSQWLASLSLFKQAWMEVIKDNASWWWSSEICIITVGTWALFLRHESARLRIAHVWTVMALGQLVAISFALNLFNLAVIYRLETASLLDVRGENVIKPHRRIFESAPDNEEREDGSPEPSTESELSDSSGQDHGAAMPVYGPRHNPSVRVLSTVVTTQRKLLPPSATYMDQVGRAMHRWMPEKVGLPLFVLAGMSSVLQHPDSFTKVMVMHVFPLLITLYVHSLSRRQDDGEKRAAQALFGAARIRQDGTIERPNEVQLNFGVRISRDGEVERRLTPGLSRMQAVRRMFARSESHKHIWQDPKMLYFGLGLASIGLRGWLSIVCFLETDAQASMLQRLWDTVTLLFPTTFFRHAAQSSISSDHMCVALSASVFVLLESGLWLFNAAASSPSAINTYIQRDYPGQLYSTPGKPLTVAIPILRLDGADRNFLEMQAQAMVALVALSPLLGGSATMSLYLAVRYTWVEQYQQDRMVQDFACTSADDSGRGRGRDRYGNNVLEEREEVDMVENEKGERYLEIRNIKVSQLVPGVGGATRDEVGTRTPWAGGSRGSSRSGESAVKQEGGRGQERGGQPAKECRSRRSESRSGDTGAAAAAAATAATAAGESFRRTTPLRQRQAPQRYQGGSP